ncbi:hypothetical protein HID58_096307, partial [Brassica napus]
QLKSSSSDCKNQEPRESEKLHCLIPAPKAYVTLLSGPRQTRGYVLNVKVTRGVDKAEGELSQQRSMLTLEFISPYSSYALSIALIGVGDGRWEDMRKFDDKIPKREFDNFKIISFPWWLLHYGDNAPFHESDDNSSTWYDEGELLWTPSLPQKLRIGIVLSKGQLPGGHTVVHGPFDDVVLRLSSLSFLDAVSKTCIERYGTILKTLDFDSIFITHSFSFCSFLILSTSASTFYVDDETSMLHEMAKNASITVLGETTSHNSVNLTWPLV